MKSNSQRVPRKNYREFNGEPLYKHTHRLQNVVVYSRNPDLVGDKVSVCDLIKYYILKFDVKDPIAQIHVTNPFLSSKTVREASKLIDRYDSIISCTKYNSRFWRMEEYGPCPINHNPLKLEQTQDLPALYEENSAFYIFKPEVFDATNQRVGQNPYFYPIGYPEYIDIDTEEDWRLVKIMEKMIA